MSWIRGKSSIHSVYAIFAPSHGCNSAAAFERKSGMIVTAGAFGCHE
jgi:hypothetical protein